MNIKSIHFSIFLIAIFPCSNAFSQERVQSGTYSIPGTLTFTTTARTVSIASIGNAIDTLNQYAVENGGVVTFNIAPGYIENATKSYSLGGTSTNFFATVYTSITFQKSGSGANPKIKASTGVGTNDFFIQLLGADNVTFNGIDLEEISSNTSLFNTASPVKPMEYGYYIRNSSTGANYNTIKNCVIRLHHVVTTNTGTITAADTNTYKSIGVYQYNDNTATPNIGNLYDSIWILKAYKGMVLDGLSAAAPDLGTEVRKCIIGGNNAGGTPGDIGSSVAITSTISNTVGLEANFQKDLSVHDCEIMNVIYNRTTATNTHGVYLNSNSGACSFYRNKIHDIYHKHNSSATGTTVSGLKIESFDASSTIDVYNNMLYHIENNSATQGTVFQSFGIAVLASAGNINFYHNTISLTTNPINHKSASFYIPTGSTATFNVLNNLFRNNVTPNGIRLAYEFYIASGTLNKCNYNIYDSTAFSSSYQLGHYFGTDYTSLPVWRNATGKDANSPTRFAANLIGSGITDAHLGIGAPDSRYNGLSINTAGYPAITSPVITDDIDKDPRIFYYIGADEPNFSTPTVRITNNNPNDSSVTRGTTQPLAGLALTPIGATNHITRINFGTSGSYLSTDFTNLRLFYNTINDWVPIALGGTAKQVPGTISFTNIPAAGGTNLNFTFPSFTLTPATGTYYFFVLFDIANPAAVAGDNVRIASLDSTRIFLDAGTTKIGDVPTVFQGGLQTVVDVYYNWGDSLPGIRSAYVDSLEGWYEPYGFTAPLNFSADNQSFVFIHNNSLMAGAGPTGTNWTVTGNNSKIIVGDPTKVSTVTFVATDTIVTSSTGVKIDIRSGGILRLRTDSIPDFGTLSSGSTVDYFGASAGQNQKIRNANYYNLILSGLGTRTFTGSVGVAGAFTPNSYTSCPVMGTMTFNGTAAQTVPGTFTYRGLRINNSSVTGVSTAGTGTGGKIIVDSILYVSTNFTVSAPDSLVLNPAAKVRVLVDTMLVNGKLFNNNPTDTAFLGTTTSLLQFASGALYSLDGTLATTSVGQIPAATWAATSNLRITDVRNPNKAIRVGTPTAVGFGNVSFDAPQLSVSNYKVLRNFMVGGTGSAGSPFQVNIQGDLLLGRSNNLNADLNSDSVNSGSFGMTVNIAGNLIQRAGSYTFNNPASSAAVNNLNVTGKDSIDGSYVYSPNTGYSLPSFTLMGGGTFGTSATLTVSNDIVMQGASNLDLSSSTNSKPGIIKAGGNLTAGAGSTITESGTVTSNEIQFTKTGTQVLTDNGATFSNDINYLVKSTSIAQLGNASSFILVNTGGKIGIETGGKIDINGGTITINGVISTSASYLGTYSGSAASNMILGGTAGGSIGTVYFTSGAATLNNFSMDRAGTASSVLIGGSTGLTINGTLTIGAINANNTVSMGVNALAAGGSFATNMSASSTLLTQNTTATPLPAGSNWGGTVWYNSASPQTMLNGNFYILNGTNGNRTLSSTGSIGISAPGNCFITGAGTYTVTNSTVDFNGNTGQNIPAFTFENLVISDASNAVTTKSLVGNIAVRESLTLSNKAILGLANSNLNLLSTNLKTARLNPVTTAATITYGTGQVFVQRYIPAQRKWRLMTAPVDPAFGPHYISEAWQELQSGTGLDYSTGTNPSDTVPVGFATQITGGSQANGFDKGILNNPSIKYFNAGSWAAPLNTNMSNVYSKEGWMLFVRGDRTGFGQITGQYKSATVTTLRPRGRLRIGSKTINPGAAGYTVIGNPYASAIDFNSIYASRTSVGWPANATYVVWDPSLGGLTGQGAFVTLTWNNATLTFDRSAPFTGTGTSTYDNRYIPSGAAILVNFPAAGGTLTINETDKSTANTTAAFRPAASHKMMTVLNTVTADNSTYVSDGSLSLFDESFNNKTDENDAIKLGNFSENFGLRREGKILSIERRKNLTEGDTVFYYIGRMKQQKYQLQFIMENINVNASVVAFLEDTYLKTKTPVGLNGDSRVDFNVTADSGSFAEDRFRLVFSKSVTYTALNAYVRNSDIAVDWQVADELNINKYEVERSSDGNSFLTVYTKSPDNNNAASVNYNWLDADPSAGYYYYRIKGESNSGVITYSNIIKVKIVKSSPSFYVFPNPVEESKIQLQLNKAQAGLYKTRLISTNGQVLNQESIIHAGGTATYTIRPHYDLKPANYQLEVTAPDNKITVIKVVVGTSR